MKKFLSMVLALVMAMSLVTVSAGADFTDAADINYAEAVEVMTAVKVVDGYTDGSFNPQGLLTRGAAAKIICNMILGPTTASALVADTAPFSDVAVDNVYAGYIAYCSQMGIINGYTDGTFKPGAPLTGYAYMKMLLGALGYDAEVEGYVAPNWSINVAKRALNIGLDDGLLDAFNGVKQVNREEALLYAFNAMKSDMVGYDTTITIGDVVVAGSKAEEIENKKANQGIAQDGVLQFAEKYFPKLKGFGDKDAFDRPATTWKNGTKTIGTYMVTPDFEDYTSVKRGDMYVALGMGKTMDTTEYYIDGVEQTNVEVKKGNTTDSFGGKGVLTQAWYDDEAETLIVSEVNTYVGKVASVTAATSTADRYITVTKAIDEAPKSLNAKFETESFAKGDLVMYTAAQNATETGFEIQSVEALELTATGILTEWNGTNANTDDADEASAETNFTVDGETYEYSKFAYVVSDEDFSNNTLIPGFDVDESEINVYLDNYGYAIYVSGVEGETNYAALIGFGQSNQYGSETRGATLLFADGTKKEVIAKLATGLAWTDFTTNGGSPDVNLVTDGLGDIITYTVDDAGIYTLSFAKNTAAKYDDTYADADDEIIFVNGRSLFILDDYADNDYNENSADAKDEVLYTTAETVFMVVTNKVPTDASKGINYNVYVGYENMPSIDITETSYGIAYVCDSSYKTQINMVYLYVPTLAGINDVDTYIVKKDAATIITNSKGDYYVLPAIVEGEEATVMISADYVAENNDFVKKNGDPTKKFEEAYGLYALNNVIKNSNNIITSFAVVNGDVFNAENGGEGTVAANKVVLGLDGSKTTATFWAYNDDTAVYVVDKDYKTISVSSVADVETDANDLVFASHDSDPNEKKLVDVIVVDVTDEVASTDASLKSFKVKGIEAVDGKVVLTNIAAASGAKKMEIVTNDDGADYTLEIKNDAAGLAWTTYTGESQTNALSGVAWTNGDLQVRVTVTAEDGESTAVYTFDVDYERYYTMTLKTSSGTKAMVSVDGKDAVMIDDAGKEFVVDSDARIAVVECAGGLSVDEVTVSGSETVWGGTGDVYTVRDIEGAFTATIALN